MTDTIDVKDLPLGELPPPTRLGDTIPADLRRDDEDEELAVLPETTDEEPLN